MASFMVTNPFDGVMNSLPLTIFGGARSPDPMMITRAFGTAGVLLILVLILFILARLAARPASNKPGPIRRLRRLVGSAAASLSSQSRVSTETSSKSKGVS